MEPGGVVVMAVTKRGQLWKGTSADDLGEMLTAYARSGAESMHEVVPVACGGCGGRTFRLEVDDEEGYARRTCSGCAGTHAMLDSAEQEDGAEPEECACPCGGEEFELAVGFARNPDGDIRWVFVAARCIADGSLGVYTDWSIDYLPAEHLLTAG
jgi:hypothetical protein